jgi:cell division cycle protein 20 (cofactor of APC complex)
MDMTGDLTNHSNTSTFTMDPVSEQNTLDSSGLAYQYEVAKACGLALEKRILSFRQHQPGQVDKEDSRSKFNRPVRPKSNTQHMRRKIPTVPER